MTRRAADVDGPPRTGARIALVALGAAATLLALPPSPIPLAILVADLPFVALLFFQNGLHWKRWSFAYGFTHYAFALRWLGEVHPIEVPAAALVLAPVYLLLGMAIRGIARWRVPFVPGVGVAVVLEEMLRTVWMGGMPWPMRSLTFATEAPSGAALASLVPAAGVVGAYAFSFLAGSTSALLFGVLRLRWIEVGQRGRARRRVLVAGLVPLLTLFGLLVAANAARAGHDARRRDGTAFATTGDFLAIQAVIPQDLKAGGGLSAEELFARHIDWSASAVAAAGDRPIEGLLWPETMVPFAWLAPGLEARFPPAWRDQVGVVRRLRRDVLDGRDLDVFLGVLSRHPAGDGRARATLRELPERDSVIHVRPALVPTPAEPMPRPPGPGERPPWAGAAARHDKVNLVPGGEYTPLGEVFPFLERIRDLVSSIPELEPGEPDQEPFRLEVGPPWIDGERPIDHRVLRLGSVICFDLAFPATCRSWRRRGADVLLNPANYGWFGPTEFRAQALSLARLRAAETGTTVVMAGNTGPTAFLDPVGRPYGRFRTSGVDPGRLAGRLDTTYVEGWAEGPLIADPRIPPYVWIGDLPWFAAAALLAGCGLLRRRRREG